MTQTPGNDPPVHDPLSDPELQDPGPVPIDPGPHPDDPGPIARIKLLSAPGVKLRVVITGSLILGIGALLAPEAAQTALSTPQERAAPLLEEQVQLRDVVQPFRGVQDIPLAVRQHGVAVLRAQPPAIQPVRDFLAPRETPFAGFAVSLSGTQLLSHSAALGGRREVQIATGDGTVMTARVAAYERATGLVLLQTDSAAGQPITMVSTTPAAGMLSVAAGWLDGGDVTVPVFVTSVAADRFEIGSAHGTVWPGMPVYNLDGEPFAIAATDGQAYPLLLAATRLLALAAAGDGPTSFGIAFQDLTEGLTRTFGTAGAIVSDVVPAGPADRAGIVAGDTLLAVDKVDVESAEMAAAALSAMAADSTATLRIRRSGRNRTITVTPVTTFEVDALVQGRPAGDASAPLARALFPPERLAIAGVPESARVVAVNGRSVTTPAQAQAAERRGQSTVLTLRHDNNRFFAALEASK